MKRTLKMQNKRQVALIVCMGISMVVAVVGWTVVSRDDETPTGTAQLSENAYDAPTSNVTETSNATESNTPENDGTVDTSANSENAAEDHLNNMDINAAEDHLNNMDIIDGNAANESTGEENAGGIISPGEIISAKDITKDTTGMPYATPDSKDDDGHTAAANHGIAASNADSPVKQAEETADWEPAQDEIYVWQDGDREMRAYLQTDLTADPQGAVIPSTDTSSGSGNADTTGLPVFRSESGALMTLPGGVLVCLNPEWSDTQIETFFISNDVAMSAVSPMEYLDDCFEVETDPGFASLNLSNTLAAQDGVEIANPNWWTEAAPA